MTGVMESLGIPALPARAFSRERLVELIDVGTRGRATIVVAPAGYGKSVAVTQWRHSAGDRPVAWIDLGPAADDAVNFARALAGALAAALPADLVPGFDVIDVGGRSLGRELIDRFVADMALVPDIVIVLDNFEVVRTPELIADVASLVTRAPATTHFVLVSRSDPGIGVGRLRVAGELTELRADDLSMTTTEAAALLAGTSGLVIDDDVVEQIVARTSGWPAALQLAAVTLRDVHDPVEFAQRFSGDDRHVADYLTEEVLAACDDDERRFLIDTSILQRANGALCDFVTGGVDGEATLQRLERGGMLLTRLDGPGRWYRYHPLLRDLLRTELEMGQPARHRELLLRAAEWHEARSDITLASEYLVSARAWDELLDMTRLHGRACFERGLATTLRSRVEAIPDNVRLRSTHAVLTSATLHLLTGQSQFADEELSHLEQSRTLTPWEQTIVDVERSAMCAFHLEPARALESGRHALIRLGEMGVDERPVDVLGITSLPSLEVVALVAMGRAAHYLGRDDEAREYLARATERTAGAFLPWYLHSLGSHATVEALVGNLRTATALASRVIDVAAEAGMASHPATAEAHVALAVVRREQDDLADAAFGLDLALGLIQANRRMPLLRLHAAETAWLELASGRHRGTPNEVAADLALAVDHPAYIARTVAATARRLSAVGDVDGAARVLDEHVGLSTPDTSLAAVAVAVARRDVDGARRLLATPEHDPAPRRRSERLTWEAVVEDLDGDRHTAARLIADAAEVAEREGLRRVFLDAGPEALRLVRAHHSRSPSGFLRSIVDREPSQTLSSPYVADLVEQLTDRELAVLRYLPTRLSNVEIARRLYVSVNTVKTHLKHIYRKLAVASRSEAIERAETLGLL